MGEYGILYGITVVFCLVLLATIYCGNRFLSKIPSRVICPSSNQHPPDMTGHGSVGRKPEFFL